MRNQNIQGIILKKHNVGEYDQYVTIYSPALGKIEAMAKSARKITSNFGGHLEILNICNFDIYKSAHNYTIVQCQTINSFKLLKQNLQLSMLAFMIAEIFYKMTPSDNHGEDLFLLIMETLSALSTNNNNPLILESFKIKLLQATGSLPDISSCSNCNHKWTDKEIIYMDNDGHINCKNCKNEYSIKERINFNMMKLVNYIANSNYQKISKIKLLPKEQNNLKKISDIFLHSYINVELKSEKIIQQMLI